MVQYLARFLPNLAADLEPLRHLRRKNVAWNWTPTCEKAAQTVKDKISHPPVLAYFDPSQTLYRLTAVKMASVLFCCRMTNPSSLHPAH